MIPDEAEIIAALRKLKNRRAPGALCITVEDLKGWYHSKATNTEKRDEDAIYHL